MNHVIKGYGHFLLLSISVLISKGFLPVYDATRKSEMH